MCRAGKDWNYAEVSHLKNAIGSEKKEKIMKLSERIKGKPLKIRSLKIDKKLIDIHQTHELHFNDRSCLNY